MKAYLILFLVLSLISCNQPEQKPDVSPLLSVSKKDSPNLSLPPTDDKPTAEEVSIPQALIYSWKKGQAIVSTLESRIHPPKGYKRIPLEKGSFGEWLRFLPLQTVEAPVHLYNGDLKGNQNVHFAVVDMDVGSRDLQQCADAVMRLKAEYHYSNNDYKSIHFNYTSGDEVSFENWRKGKRPKVAGNKVNWIQNGTVSDSYKNFKAYLIQIFNYAGTASLSKEMKSKKLSELMPGDVFIQGGFPGHAVLVLDVATNEKGAKVFMLGQSYMPAQEFHVLKNPNDANESPWYDANVAEVLFTPEWQFKISDLKEFK